MGDDMVESLIERQFLAEFLDEVEAFFQYRPKMSLRFRVSLSLLQLTLLVGVATL